MKIWLILCFTFCFYLISILIDEQYDVFYVLEDKKREIKISVCFELNDLKLGNSFGNRSLITIGELKNELINVFRNLNDSNFNGFKLLGWSTSSKYILKAIELNRIYFFNFRICFIMNENDGQLVYLYSYSRHLIYSVFDDKPYMYIRDYFNFIRVHHIVVKNIQYPYSTCQLSLDDNNKNEIYSKFICLNNEFIKNKPSLRYYYDLTNETRLIELDYNYDHNRDGYLNDYELECLNNSKCFRDDCKKEFIKPEDLSAFTHIRESLIAYPKFENMNFYSQLLGILFLITNISIIGIFSILINFIKLRKSKNNSIHLVDNKLAQTNNDTKIFYLICFVSVSYLYYELISDFNFKTENPLKKQLSIFKLEYEVIQLVICVPIDQLVSNDLINLENQTFKKLENLTDNGLNKVLDGIYLAFVDKKQPVDWRILDEVYFIMSGKSKFSRCFQIRVDSINEQKYQSLISISRLVIEPKNFYSFNINCSVHLLTDKEYFIKEKYFYLGSRTFFRKIIRNYRNCIDYKLRYGLTRDQLINKCQLNEFYKLNSTISSRILVNKNFLTKFQWENSKIDHQTIDNKPKNSKIYKLIHDCQAKWRILECYSDTFKESNPITRLSENQTELNLFYKWEYEIEIEQEFIKLVFDLINIQTIFLGFNFFKSLISIFYTFKYLIKTNYFLKLIKFKIYLICLILFTAHCFYIFDQVLNGEFAYSRFYQSLDLIEYQEVIFCIEYNESLIDPNHRITGKYIENQINFKKEDYFESIKFLNESNKWENWDFKNENLIKNKNVFIRKALFQKFKCFIIHFDIVLDAKYFLFKDNSVILKITLNYQYLKNEKQKIYFITKKKDQVS